MKHCFDSNASGCRSRLHKLRRRIIKRRRALPAVCFFLHHPQPKPDLSPCKWGLAGKAIPMYIGTVFTRIDTNESGFGGGK